MALIGSTSKQTTNYEDSSQTLGAQDSDGSNIAGGDQNIRITETDQGSVEKAFNFGSDALGANTDTTARSLDTADNAFNKVLAFADNTVSKAGQTLQSAAAASRSEGSQILQQTAQQRTKNIMIVAGAATALGAVYFLATRG